MPAPVKEPSHAEQICNELNKVFRTNRTQDISWRRSQLQQLQRMLHEHQDDIVDVLKKDLGKPLQETFMTEISLVKDEVEGAISNLECWMRHESVTAPLIQQPSHCYVRKQPKGVVFIISPWNYPINLTLIPLIGAIAAGNCALVKMSRKVPNCSNLLNGLISKYLDNKCIRWIYPESDAEINELLPLPWGHIFFTGSTNVGKKVMAEASKNLVPFTLELGGKSPVIVDKNIELDVSVRRILWGKFSNTGQTCIAPDYLLVHKDIADRLLQRMVSCLKEFYGEDPRKSSSYGRIVAEEQLKKLVNKLQNNPGKIVFGGNYDFHERYLAPTIIRDVPLDHPLMTEEIFGPILPVLTYNNLDEAINFVRDRPNPLAVYVFTQDKEVKERVLQETLSGGACVNETLMHYLIHDLPFGGIGHSGFGSYHGKRTFDELSHKRAIVEKTTTVDPLIRYPPYTTVKEKVIQWLQG